MKHLTTVLIFVKPQVILYLLAAGAAFFVTLDLTYIDFTEWNKGQRLIYVITSIVLLWISKMIACQKEDESGSDE